MPLHSPDADLAKRLSGDDGRDVREALLAFLVAEGVSIQARMDKEESEVQLRWYQGRKQFLLEFDAMLRKQQK